MPKGSDRVVEYEPVFPEVRKGSNFIVEAIPVRPCEMASASSTATAKVTPKDAPTPEGGNDRAVNRSRKGSMSPSVGRTDDGRRSIQTKELVLVGAERRKVALARAEGEPQGIPKKLLIFINQGPFVILVNVFTIWALFGDDIKYSATSRGTDGVFDVLSMIALLLFLFEFGVKSAAEKDYVLSFYFWLDFLACVSMVPDISIMFEPLLDAFMAASLSDDDSAEGTSERFLAATKVGTKSSRIVKLVRLVRLVRLVKVWKAYSGGDVNVEDEEMEEEPSKIGLVLQEKTMRVVIVVVLSCLLLVPFFDAEFIAGVGNYERQQYGIDLLHRAAQDYNVSDADFHQQIHNYVRQNERLVYIDICPTDGDMCSRPTLTGPGGVSKDPNNEKWTVKCEPEDVVQRGVDGKCHDGCSGQTDAMNWGKCMRYDAEGLATSNGKTALEIRDIARGTMYLKNGIAWRGYWSETNHPELEDYSPSTDIKTSVVDVYKELRESEIVPVYAVGCFHANHTEIVGLGDDEGCMSKAYFSIRPFVVLESALSIMRTIFYMIVLFYGSHQLRSLTDQYVVGPIGRIMECVRRLADDPMGATGVNEDEAHGDESGYETTLLLHTIDKIGRLLQVGFGEAGAAIIAKNMSTGDGTLDPMIPGHKMNAVFGFCDIRNFTDTTECLQEEVMVYVNKVGSIVHGATHDWHGAANKNIGDAFLLVWRLDAPRVMHSAKSFKSKAPTHIVDKGNMADNALVAFVKVIIDLKNANDEGGNLFEYKAHPAILNRFGPGFEIKLGMGLHIGWAIEGAIGSSYKIDASYLSPNVNIAARLEAATKQFKTPLLLSHVFVDELSAPARKLCRMIDKVTVKGSVEPLGLYTFDIMTYPKAFAEPVFAVHFSEKAGAAPVHERKRWDWAEAQQVVSDIQKQEGVNPRYFPVFQEAVEFYLKGDWASSAEKLKEVLTLKPDDGPTLALYGVLERRMFTKPEGWDGCRELTEK